MNSLRHAVRRLFFPSSRAKGDAAMPARPARKGRLSAPRARLQLEGLENRDLLSTGVASGYVLDHAGTLYRDTATARVRIDNGVQDFAVSKDGSYVYCLEAGGNLRRFTPDGGNSYLVNPNVKKFAVAGEALYVLYNHGEFERRIPGVSRYFIDSNVETFVQAADGVTVFEHFKDKTLWRLVPGVSRYLIDNNVQSFATADGGGTVYEQLVDNTLWSVRPGVDRYLVNANVQSFAVSPFGVYILYTHGEFERRIPGVSRYLIDDDVKAFAMADGGAMVYEHGTDDSLWRIVPGVSRYLVDRNVRAFAMIGGGSSVYEQFTDGTVWRYTPGVNRTQLSGSVMPNGLPWSGSSGLVHNGTTGSTVGLDKEGKLWSYSASGTRRLVDSDVHSFAMAASGRVYAFKRNGVLMASDDGRPGYYWTSATGMQSFALLRSGALVALGQGTLYYSPTGQPSSWQASTTTGFASFAVAPNGSVFLLGNNGTVWSSETGQPNSWQLYELGSLSVTAWTAGMPYSGSISVSGGIVDSGNLTISGLPEGLSATPSGNSIGICGTPTRDGTFTITATWSVEASIPWAKVSAKSILKINPPPSLGVLSATEWIVNQPGSATIAVTGGTGGYSNLMVIDKPSWLTASLSGDTDTVTLGGTPPQTGTFNFFVQLADGIGMGVSKGYRLTVKLPPPPPQESAPPDHYVGFAFYGQVKIIWGGGFRSTTLFYGTFYNPIPLPDIRCSDNYSGYDQAENEGRIYIWQQAQSVLSQFGSDAYIDADSILVSAVYIY